MPALSGLSQIVSRMDPRSMTGRGKDGGDKDEFGKKIKEICCSPKTHMLIAVGVLAAAGTYVYLKRGKTV